MRQLSIIVMALLMPVLLSPTGYAQDGVDYEYDPLIEFGPRTGRTYIAGGFGHFFTYDLEDGDRAGGGSFFFDFEDGEQFHGAIGTHLGPARLELEVSFWEAELDQINPFAPGFMDSGDFEYLSFMGNAYIDVPVNRGLDFYIGGGIGVTQIDAELDFIPPFTLPDATTIDELDDQVWSFTAQVMAGLAFHVTPNVAVYGGYRGRYIATSEFDTNQTLRSEYIDSVDVGLRITF